MLKKSQKDIKQILDTNPKTTMRFYSMLDNPWSFRCYQNKSAVIILQSWGIGMYAEFPEDLIPLLSKIPSNRDLFINGIPRNLISTLQDHLTKGRIDISDDCHLWTLEESPDKILCDSISEEDAPYVNEHWNYRSERSIDYITWCFRTFPSSVIYEQNKPVGWSFCYNQSPYHINMGGLIVLPKYRRKGYGQQITIDLSTKVFQSDRKPILHVNRANQASQLLLKKLNFIQGEEIVFGKILPV